MNLTLFIAKRYLLAKKSHNVINIITLISAGGIALGTAALIIILSVYNGFENLVKMSYSVYESDLLISPVNRKSFSSGTTELEKFRNDTRIAAFCEIIEENVFVKYGNHESVATIKGVDTSFAQITQIKEFIKEGEFMLYHGEVPHAVLGRSMAFNLGLRVHFIDPIELYFPSRSRQLSMINPNASLNKEILFPAGLFTVEQNFDKKYIFIPIEIAAELLEYDNEITNIEIYVNENTDISSLQKEISASLGNGFQVKNRYQQNETLYKMMQSEKVSIYIILLFVLIIISCNLFGSLAMLIIEKKEDAVILRSMGATEKMIKQIFLFEGWMISLSGIAVGTLTAFIFTALQQQFGIIPMPGNFIIDSYPMILKASDMLVTVAGVSLIGLFSAMLPLFFLKKITNF